MDEKMITKSLFAASLEWNIPISWKGFVGFATIDQSNLESRIAKIEFVKTSQNHFRDIDVSIINKVTGLVDKTRFCFEDYLDANDRSDDRKDYRGSFRLWYAEDIPQGENRITGYQWYVAVPRTTRPLCEAIETYLDFFV